MSGSTSIAAPHTVPPHAVVMQMAMGGWVARAISEILKLNVPDTLQANGLMTARQLVERGLKVNAGALERVMRACTSVGLFTEDAEGRFGPTLLSDVLTTSAPSSVKVLAQEVGGTWLRIFTELGETIRTGEPQAHQVFGMGWWDYLNANPQELANFGEAMKANSQNSLQGVLEKCDLSDVKKIADLGGGFGHLVIALLEKHPSLLEIVVDLPKLIPVAKEKNPAPEAVAPRLEYQGQDFLKRVPVADAYFMKHIIHDWDDEHCLQLLRNCMEGPGRLICVDAAAGAYGRFLGYVG